MKYQAIPFNKSPKKERPVTSNEYRFELMVEGMMCVRCTRKVEKALTESNLSITNLKVDFITNRVLFTIYEKKNVEIAIQKLEEVGFHVKSSRDISNTLAGNMRILTLNINKGSMDTIINTLFGQEGPLIEEEPRMIKNKCTITYNPVNIRGSEIIQKLKETPEFINETFSFTIENPFEEDVDQIKFSEFNAKQLVTVVTISVINVILSSFHHGEHITWPRKLGMFSVYMMTVLSLTLLNLKLVGYNIYSSCYRQFKASYNVNMLTLVSIGSGVALIFGFLYIFLGIVEMIFSEGTYAHFFIMNSTHMFETSTTILTALVVGKFIEGKIKKRIYSKVNDLKNKLRVKVDEITRIVPKNKNFDALSSENLAPLLVEKDDYIQIQNQGMIPFDGFVEKGTLKVVENIQYGWEKVETKTKGHPIISGTQIIEAEEGSIMRVTEPLERTLAGRLFYEIKEAASGSASNQKKETDILSTITKYFISTVIIAAILTFMGWTFKLFANPGNMSYSYPFEKFISVLVASCPCALGIAIPMVYSIALRKGFKSGALIKDTSSLDTLQTIDTVIFDKTGTITGTYNIKEVKNITNKYDDASLWEIISIIEKDHLQHPVGLALFQEALQKLSGNQKPNHAIWRNEDKSLHEYFSSEGVLEKGLLIDNKQTLVALGNDKLLQRLGIHTPETPVSITDLEAEDKGIQIDLYLCIENEVHFKMSLSLQEDLKSNAAKLIFELQQDSKEVYILSGDNHTNALQIGQKVGIPPSHIKAEMDPEGKEKFINYLIENEKKKVMMVGDGINDIKAFKAATLSCSINFKSSQNLTYSDFIITNNNLDAISGLFSLSKLTNKFKAGILFCALIYNVPVILTASGALKVTFGIDLAAYFACWTMIIFSLFLTAIANLMELINIQDSHKVSLFERLYKRMKLSIQLQKDLYMRKKQKSVGIRTSDKIYTSHIRFFMIPILYCLK